MLSALFLGLGLATARPSLADDLGIKPQISVTESGGIATIAITVLNPNNVGIDQVQIRASVPQGMAFQWADSDYQFDGGNVIWINTGLGSQSSLSGFQYMVDTKGLSGEVQVAVDYYGDGNGTASASAKVGGASTTAAPAASATPVPATQPVAATAAETAVVVTGAGDGVIQPQLTITRDGSIATIAVTVLNPNYIGVDTVEIRVSVPQGMTFLWANSDYQFDGGNVLWTNTGLGSQGSLSGFEYKIDTKGLSGEVQLAIDHFGDGNGTVWTSATIS